jgi:hypothetical protein
MLTGKECLEFTDLTIDEIEAIAEHEHIPAIVAAEEGDYLLRSKQGAETIKRFIQEDIEHAYSHGNLLHATELKGVLERFAAAHH